VSEHLELVVIGAGPAGEKGAAQVAYFGHSVAIVDRSASPGGAAVASAGIPTKTLRESALYVTGFRHRDVYGVGLELDPHTALKHLRARTDHVVQTMTSAVAANIERHGIELIHGTARLGAERTVEVALAGGGTRVIEADRILIATGSSPFHPPGIDFNDPDILDADSVVHIDRPFGSLVVIGGGPVGCEYASIFAALGVRVTLLDSAARLLPFLDDDISQAAAAAFDAIGIDVRLEAGRATVSRDGDGLRVELESGEVLRPERVLVAAGRVGNTAELGLKDAGIETDERGRIKVDAHYQTAAEGIYAAGDVIGPPGLASVSMEQGRVAMCHAFGIEFKDTVDPSPPFGVYSIPEAAMVGLTERAAQEQGIDCEIGIAYFAGNTRSTIAGTTDGLLKLVFRRDDRRLLGVHMLGDAASELIHLGQAVLHFDGTIDYFIHTTFNLPTATDIYKYAAYDGLQRLARHASTAGTA
jgi:NAD(P) transhydrogenase